LYALSPWKTDPPGVEMSTMNSRWPFAICWSTAVMRALIVTSTTGANSLITVGWFGMRSVLGRM